LPLIAEDLGTITAEVEALRARLNYPGMKVLQIGLCGHSSHPYLPHTYRDAHWVVYTGTHDLDTTYGWYAALPESRRDVVHRSLQSDGPDIVWACIRLAMASVAHTTIIPLQDVLALGSEARMNTPGMTDGCWEWRMTVDQLQPTIARRLRDMTQRYGRAVPRV
jgi:4-alpha-glucanotransferase